MIQGCENILDGLEKVKAELPISNSISATSGVADNGIYYELQQFEISYGPDNRFFQFCDDVEDLILGLS